MKIHTVMTETSQQAIVIEAVEEFLDDSEASQNKAKFQT
jgi:hypothetical protein